MVLRFSQTMSRIVFFSAVIPLLLSHHLQFPKPEKAALWNLGSVGECVLHYNPIIYNNYGCWCGFGGSHEPSDGIDRCCMHHDNCYDAAVASKECRDVVVEYLDNYKWKCVNNTAVCTEKKDSCKAALCACDTAVVHCWSQFAKPAHKAKSDYNIHPAAWDLAHLDNDDIKSLRLEIHSTKGKVEQLHPTADI
ncbi:hypothetical protein Q1695_011512 [Nippostrongylus brasiliensis]|nr:hypothetical protein Q1695_011512 [Nippostrongylus brasiliensis]